MPQKNPHKKQITLTHCLKRSFKNTSYWLISPQQPGLSFLWAPWHYPCPPHHPSSWAPSSATPATSSWTFSKARSLFCAIRGWCRFWVLLALGWAICRADAGVSTWGSFICRFRRGLACGKTINEVFWRYALLEVVRICGAVSCRGSVSGGSGGYSQSISASLSEIECDATYYAVILLSGSIVNIAYTRF